MAFSRGADLNVTVDLSQIRGAGPKAQGSFGGTANPVKLPVLFEKVIALLNSAVGRNLTPIECCLLIDEAAACIVAGNIRRSAGMRQFSSEDAEAATAKLGLYSQDEAGNWRVDPVKREPPDGQPHPLLSHPPHPGAGQGSRDSAGSVRRRCNPVRA